jgi:hypothetical protein
MIGHPRTNLPMLAEAKREFGQLFPTLDEREKTFLARAYLYGTAMMMHPAQADVRVMGEEMRAAVHEYLCSGLNHGLVTALIRNLDKNLEALFTKIANRK